MKIAVIGLTYPFRGGISHYTTLLCRELIKLHEVQLLALKRQYPDFLFPGKTQYDSSETKLDTPSETIIDSINPLTWIRAAWRIARMKPDVILIQWWQPFFGPSFGSIALLGKCLSSAKVVFLCHNVRPHETSMIDKVLSWYGFLASSSFIVHSEEDRRNLQEIKPHATVIKSPHPSYDIFRFENSLDQAQARKKLGIEGRVILYFGYIRRYKGLTYLLDAFAQVLPELDATLLIVGEFYEDREELLQQMEDLKIRDKIVLVDHYVPNEKVGQYFAAADIVVLPYVTATQSGVIQVAYGFDRGVITTEVGGLPEAVDEGKTGLLAKPCNSRALAEAVLRFYREDLGRVFPPNIRRKREDFSWSRMEEAISYLAKLG